MSEDKIKEAFEAQYGTRNEWRDMQIYDSAWEDFRAGYLACLNGLEPLGWYTDKDGVKHDFSFRLPEGVTKP